MDTSTYDQIPRAGDGRRQRQDFLLENQNAVIALHDGLPLYVELPASVELTITFTEPGLQGDRSTGGTKPATLETGAEIQVPLFVDEGTKGQGRHPRRVLPRSRQLGGRANQGQRHALDILFQADVRDVDPREVLGDLEQRRVKALSSRSTSTSQFWSTGQRQARRDRRADLDGVHRLGPRRMPGVDRNALRIGVWNCCGAPGVPGEVAISEAVGTVEELSTDESPAFVNGESQQRHGVADVRGARVGFEPTLDGV